MRYRSKTPSFETPLSAAPQDDAEIVKNGGRHGEERGEAPRLEPCWKAPATLTLASMGGGPCGEQGLYLIQQGHRRSLDLKFDIYGCGWKGLRPHPTSCIRSSSLSSVIG